jgi:hypothetical protein
MPKHPEGELLHTITKANGEEIRITRYQYEERSTIDIRVYKVLPNGDSFATKYGIRATEPVWEQVADALHASVFLPDCILLEEG